MDGRYARRWDPDRSRADAVASAVDRPPIGPLRLHRLSRRGRCVFRPVSTFPLARRLTAPPARPPPQLGAVAQDTFRDDPTTTAATTTAATTAAATNPATTAASTTAVADEGSGGGAKNGGDDAVVGAECACTFDPNPPHKIVTSENVSCGCVGYLSCVEGYGEGFMNECPAGTAYDGTHCNHAYNVPGCGGPGEAAAEPGTKEALRLVAMPGTTAGVRGAAAREE